MAVLLLVLLLISVTNCVLFAPVLYRLLQNPSIDDLSPAWLDEFNPASYAPMQSLLADEDFSFLSCQPGFQARLYRKLRRERISIFRQYLRCFIADFNRLYFLARASIAVSTYDQSHVVTRLLRLRLRFALGVFGAEASYFMSICGLHGSLARHSMESLTGILAEVWSLETSRQIFQPIA